MQHFVAKVLDYYDILKVFLGFAIINVINISCNPNLTEVFVQKYFNINLST